MTFRMGLCCCTCEVLDDFDVEPQEDYLPAGFMKVGSGSLDIVEHPDPIWVGTLGNILKITGSHTGFISGAEYERLDYQVRLYDVFGEVDKTCKRRLVIWWQDADNYVALEDQWYALAVHSTQPGVTTSSRSNVRLIRREEGVDTVLKYKWYPFAVAEDPATRGSFAFFYHIDTIDVFYDAASGWLAWKSANNQPHTLSGGYGGEYKFDPPLGPGRIGVVTAEAETPTAIDNFTVYTSRCQEHLGWWQCDQAKFLWPDELNLRISGFDEDSFSCPSANLLNDDYVLQRDDETDLTKFPYRILGPVGTFGGIVYRYTLPSAICDVKHIDAWFGGPSFASPTLDEPGYVFLSEAGTVVWGGTLDLREAIDEGGHTFSTDCREIRWAEEGSGGKRVEIWF